MVVQDSPGSSPANSRQGSRNTVGNLVQAAGRGFDDSFGELPRRHTTKANPRRSSHEDPAVLAQSRRHAQAAILLNMYVSDAQTDSEESLHKLQYLLIQVENIIPDTAQPVPGAPRSDSSLEGLQRPVLPSKDLVKAAGSSGPALGLLRCINTIVGRGAAFRLQEQLQRLVLMYTGSANAKDFEEVLPPGMRSPRSVVHVQDRLKHWETMRKEVDLVHYMHDKEVPDEIRTTGKDEHAGPEGRLALIQELRRNSDPKLLLAAAKTPPQPAAAPRHQRNRPQSSSGDRERHRYLDDERHNLAELARKARMLEGNLEVCDVSHMEAFVRRDKATELLARALAGPEKDEREPVIETPADGGLVVLASGAKSKAPPLTGVTSGFMARQLQDCPNVIERFLVTYPSSSSKQASMKEASSCPSLPATPKHAGQGRQSIVPGCHRQRPQPASQEEQSTIRVTDKELREVQARIRRKEETQRGNTKTSATVGMSAWAQPQRSSSTPGNRTTSRRQSSCAHSMLGGAQSPGGLASVLKGSSSRTSLLVTEERKQSHPTLPHDVTAGCLEGEQPSGGQAAGEGTSLGKSGTLKVFANAARRSRVGRLSHSRPGSRNSVVAASRNSVTGSTVGALPAGPKISLECQMGDMLTKVMQQRGMERKPDADVFDLAREDRRAEEAAAIRDRRLKADGASQTLFEASPRSASKRSSPRRSRAEGAKANRSSSAVALSTQPEVVAENTPRVPSVKLEGSSPLQEAQVIHSKPKGVIEAPQKRLPTVDCSYTAEVGYLRGCMQGKVFPRLIKLFVDDSSPILDMDSQFLVDGELDAVLRALQAPRGTKDNAIRDQPISELTLANNPSLTDVCMARFLNLAVGSNGGRACIGPLKRLSLAFCTGIGEVAMGTLADLLGRGTDLVHLEELDFSNVPVPPASWPHLTTGLGCARFLRRLLLAHTGCGRSSQASCVAISELIANHSLARIEVLDLGGNHFLDEGCRALGVALRHSPDTLRELDLSHNAGLSPIMFAKDEESNPITHVLEALGETTLEKAAFVNCQLAHKEDCVLEASVTCSDITHLDVSDNPHGETGLRCLVRLLAGEAPRLETLCLESVRLHPACGQMTYDYSNPTFPYSLHMENVQHRSILRLLLKRSELATGNSRCACFRQIRFNDMQMGEEGGGGGTNGILQLCRKRKDRGGDDWQVPDKGFLTFFFQMPSVYDSGEKIDLVYNKFQRRNKICPNFKCFAKLLQVYKGLVDKQSKLLFLESMSKDLCLKFCQVKHLGTTTQDLLTFVLRSLLPETTHLPLRSTLFDLVVCCSKSWPEALPLKLAGVCRNLVFFNFVHPDGHYRLSLENPADRATAQRCIVAARWIKAHCQAKGLLDISEYGDGECMWHVVHNSQEVRGVSTEWQLQERGKLIFDFVLPRVHFGKQGPAEEARILKSLGEAIRNSPCKFRDRLHALHLVAHQLVLTPDQLKEALQWFPAWFPMQAPRAYTDMGQVPIMPRAEAYVTLYNRTLDHAQVVSPRVLYNSSILHKEEVHAIRKRLGMMHTFDIMNLHDPRSNLGTRHGPMDLVTWDGFTILKAMVAIEKEEASVNFQDGFWSVQADFYERGFAFILPAKWHPDPPREGQFTTTFMSKDDEVNFAQRREVARRLLGWTFPDSADT